ncbi:MAG: hypothetical protein J5I65_16875 [Aridibacter famidurans]|nr:hypothetical protein [Aridibacter famidurans]
MEVLVVRSEDDAGRAIEALSGSLVLGCDTETSGLHPSKGRLLSIQFSDGEHHVLIPVSEGVSVAPFRELLAEGSVTKVFHNARFDLGFIGAAGYEVHGVYDSMIAEKVLTKGADQSVSLAETLYRYFAVDLDKSKRKKFGRNWSGIWTDDLVEYAMNDVVMLPGLMREQRKWLQELNLERDYDVLVQTALG